MDLIERRLADEYFRSRKFLEKVYLSGDSVLQDIFSSCFKGLLNQQESQLVEIGFFVDSLVLLLFWGTPAVIIDLASILGVTLD